MVDIDRYVRRALAEPVAAPPPMDAIKERARHRRNRKRGALAVATLVIVVATATILVMAPGDGDGPTRVVASGPGRAPDRVGLTAAELTNRLTAMGSRVTRTGTASGWPIGGTAELLCVDGTQARVYEFETRATRTAASHRISRDGSHITVPGGMVIPEWIGPPHFFARGRVIVLVLQDDETLLDALTRITGPTISPDAAPDPNARAACPEPTR